MYVQGDTVVVQAPAKLNLHFEVLGRRDDGFHEVETLMMAIGLYDSLYFSRQSSDRIDLECDWVCGMATQRCHEPAYALPAIGDNLVHRALCLLAKQAGRSPNIHVRLFKRIPLAAGLGGGSSDAAAALLAANVIWKLGWSRAQLAELGAELGSDIPFFLGPGVAICRGRGEQIQPWPTQGRLHFVIIRPPVGLSTKDVYCRCQPADCPQTVEEISWAVSQGNVQRIGSKLFNRLEPAAQELTPWIGKLREELDQLDVSGHQMSGSGSSYFALCHHRRHAQRIAKRLAGRRLGSVFCATSCTAATVNSMNN